MNSYMADMKLENDDVNYDNKTNPKHYPIIAGLSALVLAAAVYLPNMKAVEVVPAAAVVEVKPAEVKPEAPAVLAAPDVKVATAEASTSVDVTPPKKPAAELNIEKTVGDAAPSFDTVRVEADGSTVIAGRAKPGVEVFATLDGEVIGQATASTDGAFVILPTKVLPEGSGSLALQTKVGNETVVSENQVAIAIKPRADGGGKEALVALVQPEGATKVIQVPGTKPVAATKVVKLDSVDYDTAGNIIFSGRSEKGSIVRFYIDNNLAGEVPVDANGNWIFKGTTSVAAGTHTLRADEVGSDGLVKSRVELPFLREDQSKVAAIENVTPSAPLGPERVVIQPGNSLWKLSRVIYGKGTRYTVIYEANKDQIKNPNKIYPGQIFAAPKAP